MVFMVSFLEFRPRLTANINEGQVQTACTRVVIPVVQILRSCDHKHVYCHNGGDYKNFLCHLVI